METYIPERETVSVPAHRTYYEPARPFLAETPQRPLQQQHDDVLDLADVTGKRLIDTDQNTFSARPSRQA
jgi:protein phosphatase